MKIFRGIVKSNTAPSTDVLWLHGKDLKHFNNGKWESINEIPTLPKEKEPVIILEEGNTKSIKKSNLSKLKDVKDSFFVATKYGYGVCNWDPKIGGQAHIVTAYGNTLYYSISSDGAVEKVLESPDIYLEYINNGGTKDYKEFIKSLVTLIE